MADLSRVATTLTSAGNTDKVDAARPSGVQDGDLLVAVVSLEDAASSPSGPSGWTQRTPAGTQGTLEQSVWTYLAGASEPSSYRWTWSKASGVTCRVELVAYRNAVYGSHGHNSANSSTASTAALTIAASSWILHGWQTIASGFIRNFGAIDPAVTELDRFQLPNRDHTPNVYGDEAPATTTPAARSVDLDAASDWVATSVEVAEDNTAPNAPKLTFPVGGEAADATSVVTLNWDFDDDDLPGDSQSAYDVEARPQGSTTLTYSNSGASETEDDVPANTFTAGTDYEWRARTTDADGLVGPWTGWEPFAAEAPPAAPTVDSPTGGQTISAAEFLVEWTVSVQQAFQVRTVADSAGSPDTSQVFYDSGPVGESATRSHLAKFETDGRDEHVQVRVKDADLWSAWASVQVSVSYTPPPTPTLAVAADVPDGATTVTVSNPEPGAGEPDTDHNDIRRRPVGTTGEGVRLSDTVAKNGAYTDWTVASGVAYEYRVTAVAANATASDSTWRD